jgi:hypothetical protein
LQRPRLTRARFALLLAFIPIAYAFFGSAGKFPRWPGYTDDYDLLAEGFRQGQLHLPAAPSPELLAKPNPFDPAHSALWRWDVSLSGGRYYLYWGPVPPLLQAAAKTVLRIHRMVGDQYLVFAFFSLSGVCGALILARLRRRLCPRLPGFVLPLSVLAFAFANPAPHLIATAGVYQAAIAGAQTFLLAGLLAVMQALEAAEEGRRRGRWLALAGVAWGLALGCRISVGGAVILLALLTLVLLPRAQATATQGGADRPRRRFRDVVALGTPLVAALVGLGLYNRVRFGSWWEFGTNLQLTTLRFRLSSEYVVINLFNYLLRPLSASCYFPFAIQVSGDRGFPAWLPRPAGYLTGEPVTGILIAVPCAWLGVIALVAAARRLRAFIRTPSLRDPHTRLFLFATASFLVLGTATGLAEIGLYMATMRYLADVTAGLTLLGLLGGWTLLAATQGRRGWHLAAQIAFVGLTGATIVFGVLLGFQGYNNHFERHNLPLYTKLVGALSVCR